MAERETSIRRGIDVLLALGWPEATDHGGLSVTRMAELLGREKSQVSRSLKTLAEYGLVDRDPDTLAYTLGWRVFALAELAAEQRLLIHSDRVLSRLSAQVGERAYLSILRGTEAVVLLSKSPARSLQALAWVGRTYPAFSSATGHALLCEHEPETLVALLADVDFVTEGSRAIRSRDELVERLAQIREQGYSISDGEFEEGLVSVAAPVRDHLGRVVAAVNVSGPTFRLGGRLDEAVAAVRRAAQEISTKSIESKEHSERH
ncbi:MAG: IclR family transcriptional regulator [Nocardioidaceae bacterium]